VREEGLEGEETGGNGEESGDMKGGESQCLSEFGEKEGVVCPLFFMVLVFVACGQGGARSKGNHVKQLTYIRSIL